MVAILLAGPATRRSEQVRLRLPRIRGSVQAVRDGFPMGASVSTKRLIALDARSAFLGNLSLIVPVSMRNMLSS